MYPQVTSVFGHLGSSATIEEEASQADIVLHFASCDDVPSAEAIAKGLGRRDKEKRPAYWIHTSGAMIMATESLRSRTFGVQLERKYDDWDGVRELLSLPDDAPHRHVDKIVQQAGSDHEKTAIVCPPTVYGPTRGIGNASSMQINEIARIFLMYGRAFQVNQGKNIWHEVHVQDLSDIYVALTEAAATCSSRATWNEEGYYLAENGQFYWGDVCKAMGDYGYQKDLLSEPGVQTLDPQTTHRIWPRYNPFVGSTSRGVALRARNLLDWTPHRPTLQDTIPWIVESEHSRLKDSF